MTVKDVLVWCIRQKMMSYWYDALASKQNKCDLIWCALLKTKCVLIWQVSMETNVHQWKQNVYW